ncbi:SAVED domain-containing protein [Bradyrhizobium sp. HKCCYLRH2015]|uniref:SAVED domain-containing protein n=1 Tax=Bradyrhizobium sp. HKCCYLRH2015 TaxID=3420742 RepID=UPI003EB7523C
MTQAVAVRSQGDDFQARMFWFFAAQLLVPEKGIARVSFESGPRAFDDVTVEYVAGEGPQDHYGDEILRDHLQCKWHATPGQFGHLDLIDPAFSNAQSVSLLQRALAAQLQHAPNGVGARLRLVTNWRPQADDALSRLIRMHTHALDLDRLFDGTTPRSMMGKVRDAWSGHLGIDHDALRLVARTLAISQRLESGADLRERLNDRFAAVGMRQVPLSEAGFLYDDLIRKLHAQGRNTFDPASFRDLVADENLLAPSSPRPKTLGVRSFMHPIDDIEARSDESVNLVPHFDGRYIRNPADWKATVYPELRQFLIQSARDKDQLRLILDTHVSLAFGVGAILNVKSGKAIEIEQRAGGRHIWSAADKPLDPAWPTLTTVEEAVHADGTDLAVAVSLTHDVAPAVSQYVQKLAAVGTLMTASPVGGPSYQSVRSGSHAAALALSLLGAIRASAKGGPRRVHLFIAGPNAFAFFLGQSEAAIGPVSIYEWDFDGLRDGDYSVGLELP